MPLHFLLKKEIPRRLHFLQLRQGTFLFLCLLFFLFFDIVCADCELYQSYVLIVC